MTVWDRIKDKIESTSTLRLQRYVVITTVALITVTVLFTAYYLFDRYSAPATKSPNQHGIEQLQTVIQQDPQNVEARLALAQLLLEQGQPALALDHTTVVLKAFPDNEPALLISGVAYAATQQFDAASTALEKFVALRRDRQMAASDMNLETAYYYLGQVYLEQRQPDRAVAALEAAITISPTDADALNLAGRAYQALGQHAHAIARWQRAAKLVTDFDEAYTGLINSYSALNQTDHVAYARGMQAFARRDYATARAHLEHATGALPEFAPAFLGLGLTYEQLGQVDAALKAIQRAAELTPEDFATVQALSRLQMLIKSQGG